jgi:hypothetical protein
MTALEFHESQSADLATVKSIVNASTAPAHYDDRLTVIGNIQVSNHHKAWEQWRHCMAIFYTVAEAMHIF